MYCATINLYFLWSNTTHSTTGYSILLLHYTIWQYTVFTVKGNTSNISKRNRNFIEFFCFYLRVYIISTYSISVHSYVECIGFHLTQTIFDNIQHRIPCISYTIFANKQRRTPSISHLRKNSHFLFHEMIPKTHHRRQVEGVLRGAENRYSSSNSS